MRERKHTFWIIWLMGALLVGMLGSAPGATITWTGNVSSDWADPLNWSPTNAVPGTNDIATFSSGSGVNCYFPSNTTQSVERLYLRGFAVPEGKLVIQPGAALHNTTNGTTYMYDLCDGDRGIIEVQSNAVLTSSNCNFYIAAFLRSQGTMNIIGGRVRMGPWFGMGVGNESTTVSGYTGAVHVSAGGYLRATEIRVAMGGWNYTGVGRGLLTIRDEGSLVECTTFAISEGQTGASTEGNGRGSAIVYGGTLSAATFYNGHATATTSNSTNIAVFAMRGGQLLVSGNMYNTTSDRKEEQGMVTIASGATNLLVSGNYYQRTNSFLVAEITATSHPPLKVNGTAYLAGTLQVSSNSVEQLGQWDIISGTLNGSFNTFDASTMAHPANWTLSYSTNKVTLSYSPRGTLVKCH